MKLSCIVFPSLRRPLPSSFVIFMSQRIAFVFLFFLTFSIVDRTFVNGTHFFAFKIFHIVFSGEEMKAKTMKNICKTDKNVEKCAIYEVADLYQEILCIVRIWNNTGLF